MQTKIESNERELTGTMLVQCAGCGLALGEKPCLETMDGKVSHGICPMCYARTYVPDVVRNITSAATSVDLMEIQLFVVPNIEDETARLGLRQWVSQRFAAIQANGHYFANVPADAPIGRTA